MAKALMTFTVKANPLASRKFDSDEIGRGIGVHKTRKGKGSYSRKDKYKGKQSIY